MQANPLKQLIPVPASISRDWTITVNGERVDAASACISSQFGRWHYGLHPHGYDTCWFEEPNGGGVITIPYSVIDNEIWVGLIIEHRPNMGGRRLCAIGGYIDPGEHPDFAAAREMAEEVALSDQPPTALPGPAANPNRAVYIADAERGQGCHFYCLSVAAESLQPERDSCRRWVAPESAEMDSVLFYHWREAIVRTADSLALAGIARLLASQS